MPKHCHDHTLAFRHPKIWRIRVDMRMKEKGQRERRFGGMRQSGCDDELHDFAKSRAAMK